MIQLDHVDVLITSNCVFMKPLISSKGFPCIATGDPEGGLCIPIHREGRLKHVQGLQHRKVKLSPALIQQCVETGVLPMGWSTAAGDMYSVDMWCMNAYCLIETSGAQVCTRPARVLWSQHRTHDYLDTPVMRLEHDGAGKLVLDGMIAHLNLACVQSEIHLSNGIYWVERLPATRKHIGVLHAKDCILYIANDAHLDFIQSENCILVGYEDWRGSSLTHMFKKAHLKCCLALFHTADPRFFQMGILPQPCDLAICDTLIYELRLCNRINDLQGISNSVHKLAVMQSIGNSLWSLIIHGDPSRFYTAMASGMALATLFSIISTTKRQQIWTLLID
ncbi:MAG: hypothetical protein KatS3mg054_0018 [Chloroflexus sp.]|nr:MAG: hypothetical protein KatS3mg054_0018 [Chloroflexus sp.]